MRKIGLSMLAAGMIVLIAIGVKSIKEKKDQIAREEIQESRPFPWYPLVGGILVASGIILMSRKERSK